MKNEKVSRPCLSNLLILSQCLNIISVNNCVLEFHSFYSQTITIDVVKQQIKFKTQKKKFCRNFSNANLFLAWFLINKCTCVELVELISLLAKL